jgi:hypothetical protein
MTWETHEELADGYESLAFLQDELISMLKAGKSGEETKLVESRIERLWKASGRSDET